MGPRMDGPACHARTRAYIDYVTRRSSHGGAGHRRGPLVRTIEAVRAEADAASWKTGMRAGMHGAHPA